MQIEKPKILKEQTIFKTADSLEEAANIAVEMAKPLEKNKVITLLNIYHNTLVDQLNKRKEK